MSVLGTKGVSKSFYPRLILGKIGKYVKEIVFY